MAALSQDRLTKSLGVPTGGAFLSTLGFSNSGSGVGKGIADNVVIYAGALVAMDSSGYLRPARGSTATDIILGVSRRRYDNTVAGHGAGFPSVNGVPLFPNGFEIEPVIAGWDNDTGGGAILIGTTFRTPVYAIDDHTVSLTSGTNSVAGLLYGLSADGLVYVIPRSVAGVSQ